MLWVILRALLKKNNMLNFQYSTICVLKITTDKLQLAKQFSQMPACNCSNSFLKRPRVLDLHRNGAFQIRFHRNEPLMDEQPVTYMDSGGALGPATLPQSQYWSETEAFESRTSVWVSLCAENSWRSNDLVMVFIFYWIYQNLPHCHKTSVSLLKCPPAGYRHSNCSDGCLWPLTFLSLSQCLCQMNG